MPEYDDDPWSHRLHDTKLIDAALQRLKDRPDLLTEERRVMIVSILQT